MISMFFTLIDDVPDRELFEKLYLCYEKQMFYVSRSILKDEHLAEDATQNAFTRVATNIKKLHSLNEAETRSYLLTSAKNASLDILRKYSKFDTVNIDDIYMLSDAYADASFEQIDNGYIVTQTLKRLPEHYIDILYLYYVVDLSPAQISKQLNRSVNTVKKQISRGKKMFVEIYERNVNENGK